MAQDGETLFARAQAAILRSKQLADAISASHKRLLEQIAARRAVRFTPADRKMGYPQDFPEKRPAFQGFPAQDDDNEI
ncbi:MULTISPECIES: hypothetical protein [unclassified Bradyrhizobium]